MADSGRKCSTQLPTSDSQMVLKCVRRLSSPRSVEFGAKMLIHLIGLWWIGDCDED